MVQYGLKSFIDFKDTFVLTSRDFISHIRCRKTQKEENIKTFTSLTWLTALRRPPTALSASPSCPGVQFNTISILDANLGQVLITTWLVGPYKFTQVSNPKHDLRQVLEHILGPKNVYWITPLELDLSLPGLGVRRVRGLAGLDEAVFDDLDDVLDDVVRTRVDLVAARRTCLLGPPLRGWNGDPKTSFMSLSD